MGLIYRSFAALENIARNTLKNFDKTLLSGPPKAVPIEKLAEHLGLFVEIQCIRKCGQILGEMIFEKSLVPIYCRDFNKYTLIEVDAKTIILDDSLLGDKNEGRMRFTCAHEIAHWILHKDMYLGTGQAAALGHPKKSSEIDSALESQANTLATFLLMPRPQIKQAFYKIQGNSRINPIITLAELFNVSKQAMEICLSDRNLI